MKTIVLWLFLLSLLFLSNGEVYGNHLLGAGVSYRCVSTGNYEVEIRVLRDCDDDPAVFDNPLSCAIYKGNEAPYELIESLTLVMSSVENYIPSRDDCLEISSDTCFEQALYQFSIALPVVDESYHVVYQRCCGIPNLVNLVENVIGYTSTVELSAEAQEVCNNSSLFSENSIFEICLFEPFAFDLSATDADGDLLIYSWSYPLSGAGTLGSITMPGNPQECEGIAPEPACSPPFEALEFASGFTAEQPLGSASSIQLNPTTGVLVGIANKPGGYITALRISEYRNGLLLSRQQRNIYFEVNGVLGNENVIKSKLSIHPNPARENVMIILPEGEGDYELLVRDVMGRMLVQKEGYLSVSKIQMNIVDWAPGIYCVEIRTKEGRHLEKLVVR